ncbi:MAG: XRE family transcriptional regulator [Desulfurellales bacterium]|nr:MAG: XRE family transcriptional regulator [Desulfurellales bacterium]
MTSPMTKDLAPIVAKNIKAARADLGLTQRQLADAVNGLDALAVSRWERGVSLPSRDNFQALAAVTGREVAWFYTEHTTESAAA